MAADFFVTFATLMKYFLFGSLIITAIAVILVYCFRPSFIFKSNNEFIKAKIDFETIRIVEILAKVLVVFVVWRHAGYEKSNELILIVFAEWGIRKFGFRFLKW